MVKEQFEDTKRYSEAANRRTDITMAERKGTPVRKEHALVV